MDCLSISSELIRLRDCFGRDRRLFLGVPMDTTGESACVPFELLDSVTVTGDVTVLADSDFVRRLLGFLEEERGSFLSLGFSVELLRCCWLEVDLARLCLILASVFLGIGADECLEEDRRCFETTLSLNTESLVSDRVE